MARRQTMAWTELKVGLLVIVSFLLLSLAIFFVGGNAGFFTKKITITAYLPDGNGLRPGADVMLDGVLVGSVDEVSIAKEPGPDHGVDVKMKVDAQYQNIIRSDSTLGIGTIGLLGDKNIEITRGTEAGQPVADGGVIQGQAAGDIRIIITGTDDLVANMKLLSDKFVKIGDTIDRGEGTLGKLLNTSEIHDNLNEAVVEAEQLVHDIRMGPGTAGKLINDDQLYQRINGLLVRFDTVMAKVDRGDGTIGKFMNDPELYNKATQLITRFDAVAERVERGEGTLGRLIKDESLFTDLRSTVARVNGLVDSVENGDGTAGRLIKDPALFNNLNQTVSEIQKLMYDFRQAPQKYMTINFKLF